MQKVKANLAGLVVLAVLIALVSLLVPEAEVSKPLWLFAYAGLGVCALFIWHHKRAPSHPAQWLFLTACCLMGAAAWFGLTRAVAHLAFGADEPGLSRFFDIGVALMIAPGLAFVAFAGWIRALILSILK